ncbi:expressed unknown protein [Ectocarpus siliculosus]|uniref:Uncharacterized protein n=1 Tax=Ectocarpus siliculosus TaxID=2880 RepID=D7G673_ECTSI|nr:expressed unknown protein [Ectocarpus siliculosus]|eukprot:CBJ33936.1 expressed unknown protein [Ectocarpus siliculosus]
MLRAESPTDLAVLLLHHVNDLRPAALDHLVLAYAWAKEVFIAIGLQPANQCAKKRAA